MDALLAGCASEEKPLVYISGISIYVFAKKTFKPTFWLATHRQKLLDSHIPQLTRKLQYADIQAILSRFCSSRISPPLRQSEQQLREILDTQLRNNQIKYYQLSSLLYRQWFDTTDSFMIHDQNLIDAMLHTTAEALEYRRLKLSVELGMILSARWEHKIRMDDIYWSNAWYDRSLIVIGKTMQDVYEGIEGLFQLGKVIIEAVGDSITFQLDLLSDVVTGDMEKAQQKLEAQGIKLAKGSDNIIKQIKEGYAILEPILEDPDSQKIVANFLSGYVDSMTVVEKGSAALIIPFEVLLALVTAGAGAAAAGGSVVKHAGQFSGKAIDLLFDLSRALKKSKTKMHIEKKPANKTASSPSANTNKNTSKPIPAAAATTVIKEKYGSNTATWTVDKTGKPISVEAKLNSTHTGKRSGTEKDLQGTVGGKARQATDDGGHLVGHRFMSDQGAKNLFPQNANLNRSAYKKMENEWADWTDAGYEVKLKVSLHPPGSDRPDFIKSKYDVFDPETGKKVFTRSHVFDNVSGEGFDRVPKKDMSLFR